MSGPESNPFSPDVSSEFAEKRDAAQRLIEIAKGLQSGKLSELEANEAVDQITENSEEQE